MSEGETLESMKQEYLISDEKGRLAIEVADIENSLLEGLSYEGHYSLYVDIPFCPTRCVYCSFTSNAVGKDRSLVRDYIGALKEEIIYSAQLMGGRKPDSIYIGGGTPTALLPEEMDDLLRSRELIKVKLQEGSLLDPKTAANDAAEILGAEFVQAIGRRFVLYRQAEDPEKRTIVLPR